MKLHLLDRSSIVDRSLTVSHNLYQNFLRIWHFHVEFELVVIIQSSGMRFVGDNIEKFDVGDIVLIGKNVPHMWLNDDKYFEKDSSLEAEAISVHFKKDFLGPDFLNVPEMQPIANLLHRAEQGVKFLNADENVINELKILVNLDPMAQIIKIIEILSLLSKHKEYQLLSSSGFLNSFHKTENRRLDKIYEYVFENFNSPIGSGDVAKIVGMNKSAFSRFFKKTHRKPFTKYLNEIRIGYACKLLLENNESITSIAFLSGFNNISNFNRQFKMIKGKSPSSYFNYHKS
ncbi:AraC family transcriptional regulator [Flagellimonas eckloniae]|uniref:Transcriptional regulator n=1 Tax=Flagellimonas eckloniae TaxID=346185 RepID=A0A0Q0XEH3_9FLAO|nr:AraC family transcriptional regulator [Allomuricauda eckloniae]KQC29565.1 transcriptional regulator [Allomuricauda eckloniae]